MLKIMKKAWGQNEKKLRDRIIDIVEFDMLRDIEYKDLLVIALETIYNNYDCIDHYVETIDLNSITEIDDGDYQGTLVYLIPFDRYQPNAEDYLMTYVEYGSCSYCDTLQNIKYDSSTQVDDLMTLCRDMIVRLIRPYNNNGEWAAAEFYEEYVKNMVKHYCDRCGKEANNRFQYNYNKMQRLFDNDYGMAYSSSTKQLDLCDECLEKILNFINDKENNNDTEGNS